MKLRYILLAVFVLLAGCARYEVTYVHKDAKTGDYMVEWSVPGGYVYQPVTPTELAREPRFAVGRVEYLPYNSFFVKQIMPKPLAVSPFTDSERHVSWVDRMNKK